MLKLRRRCGAARDVNLPHPHCCCTTRVQENLAELFGAGPGSRGGKGTVSPGRMDHAKRRAVKEMEANAKMASAAAGVGQQLREAKVQREMESLEIADEEIMDTSATNDSVRYGGVVPTSPSHWEVRVCACVASRSCLHPD